MIKKTISVIEQENNQQRSFCPDSTILLSSEKCMWQGVMLEQHLFPPFEQSDVTAAAHLIGIHIGDAIKLEYKYKNKNKNEISSWPRQSLIIPGDICIIAEHTVFSLKWQESTEGLVLSLDADWLNRVTQESTSSDSVELVNIIGGRDRLLSTISLALRDEVTKDCSAGNLYVDCLLTTLAIHLSNKYRAVKLNEKEQKLPLGLSRYQKKQAINYIQSNLDKDLKLSEMAKVVGLSQYHFARLFKRSLGISPWRYVLQCRIERSKELLRSHRMAITEVAKATGFSSSSYFTKQFHQIVGVTPKAYQQSL